MSDIYVTPRIVFMLVLACLRVFCSCFVQIMRAYMSRCIFNEIAYIVECLPSLRVCTVPYTLLLPLVFVLRYLKSWIAKKKPRNHERRIEESKVQGRE